MPLAIPVDFLARIGVQAEKDYPHETCGILAGPKTDKKKITGIYPCRNVQDEYHALDPAAFPRDARTAYFMEPRDLLRIQREIREKEWEFRVIYHSHVDAGAYFSEEDERVALSEGRPAYPGVTYLVVSTKRSKAEEAALFDWDEKSQQFIKVHSQFLT